MGSSPFSSKKGLRGFGGSAPEKLGMRTVKETDETVSLKTGGEIQSYPKPQISVTTTAVNLEIFRRRDLKQGAKRPLFKSPRGVSRGKRGITDLPDF